MSDIGVSIRSNGKAIRSDWLILSIISFNFISYICSGLPLAVLPGYVLNDLGLTSVFAGVVISSQYLATLLARPWPVVWPIAWVPNTRLCAGSVA